MKRKLWFFAVFAVFCLMGAVRAECRHWVLCQHPTVCAVCGAENVSVPAEDVSHEWLFTDLGDSHQLYCLYCDYQEAPEVHFAACDAPSVCIGCGAKNLELSADCIVHYDEYTDLGAQHQYRCAVCGEQDEPEDHWAMCDDPVTCVGCGIIKIDIPDAEIYHEVKYRMLDGQHQLICERCDYTEAPAEHVSVCSEPELCVECGASVPAKGPDELVHFTVNVAFNITDTTHEKYCMHCGFSWGVVAHQLTCADPTTCAACGKTGLNAADYPCVHVGTLAGLSVTQTGHSFDCSQCGQHADNEAHIFDESFCCTCGYEMGTEAPDDPAPPDDPIPPDTPEPPARIPGDADGDGAVTILDGLAVLQYDVGWATEINVVNADVDGDGAVSILDALLILQKDVGWTVELK